MCLVVVETARGGLGFVAVVADWVPSPSFLAGEWVEVVVDDDVERS